MIDKCNFFEDKCNFFEDNPDEPKYYKYYLIVSKLIAKGIDIDKLLEEKISKAISKLLAKAISKAISKLLAKAISKLLAKDIS